LVWPRRGGEANSIVNSAAKEDKANPLEAPVWEELMDKKDQDTQDCDDGDQEEASKSVFHSMTALAPSHKLIIPSDIEAIDAKSNKVYYENYPQRGKVERPPRPYRYGSTTNRPSLQGAKDLRVRLG
jgi:hypothetical protein